MLKTTEKDMCKSDNDTQLMDLIDTWKMALAETKATLHAVLHVYVADEIMHERAVLLHLSVKSSSQHIHILQTVRYVLEVGEGTV